MNDAATPAGGVPPDAVPATPRPRRRGVLVLLPLLGFSVLAVLFLLRLGSTEDPSLVPSPLVGRAAPPTVLAPLPGLDRGGAAVPGFDPAAFRGKVAVVNVWASWCAPCREEHPQLMTLGSDPRIVLAGINYKDRPGNALRFLGGFGNPFAAVGVDPDGRAGIEWGVYGVPETYVLGRDGTVRFKYVGPLDVAALSGPFADAVARAVAEPDPPSP